MPHTHKFMSKSPVRMVDQAITKIKATPVRYYIAVRRARRLSDPKAHQIAQEVARFRSRRDHPTVGVHRTYGRDRSAQPNRKQPPDQPECTQYNRPVSRQHQISVPAGAREKVQGALTLVSQAPTPETEGGASRFGVVSHRPPMHACDRTAINNQSGDARNC